MAVNDNRIDVVETEIAKGERDDAFEEYNYSERKRMQDKLPSKMSTTRDAKRNVPQVSARFVSARIVELARPTKQRALNTLKEKATMLPPAFVDNLVKIIEAESCLTPEEAARVRRRKERRTRKATRLPLSLRKKRTEEIAKDATRPMMLDRDATMCQYLIAERFVKSVFEYRREIQEVDRRVADIIMKRLTFDGYADAKNGDRATQQLRLLADVVACWITDMLAEVAETHKEDWKKYDKKRQMKRLEVNDDDKTENWKQVDQMKEKIKEERNNYETTKRNNPKKKNIEEQKNDVNDKEEDKVKEETRDEKEQLIDDKEAKNKSMREETVEKEQKDEETRKREKEEEDEEIREVEEKENIEKEKKEAIMEE